MAMKKIPIYKWLSLVKPPFIENSHCDVSLRKGTRLHVAVLLLVLEIPGGKLGEISPVSASQAKSRSEQWRWLGLWSLWAQNLLWLDGKLTELQGIEALETSEGRCNVTISRRKSIILPHFWCVHVAFSGELKRYKIWIIHCAARWGCTSVLEQLTLGSKGKRVEFSHFWTCRSCRQGLAVTAGAYAGWQFRQASQPRPVVKLPTRRILQGQRMQKFAHFRLCNTFLCF